MAEQERNVDTLVVPRAGRVEGVTDGLVPYRVVDASDSVELAAVTEFLRDPSASDCSPSTLRSYAYELLGWLRFLQAVAVPWDRANGPKLATTPSGWVGLASRRGNGGGTAQRLDRSTRSPESPIPPAPLRPRPGGTPAP